MPARKRTFGDVGQPRDLRGVEEVAGDRLDAVGARALARARARRSATTASTRRGTPGRVAGPARRGARATGPSCRRRRARPRRRSRRARERDVGGRGPGEQLLELGPRRGRRRARRGACRAHGLGPRGAAGDDERRGPRSRGRSGGHAAMGRLEVARKPMRKTLPGAKPSALAIVSAPEDAGRRRCSRSPSTR